MPPTRSRIAHLMRTIAHFAGPFAKHERSGKADTTAGTRVPTPRYPPLARGGEGTHHGVERGKGTRRGSNADTAFRSTRHWMIVVAGVAVVFGVFGVNKGTSMVLVAYLISLLIFRPDVWQARLLQVLASCAALPFILLASIYTFAFRAALFLGHWPYYAHPDPKDLPVHFHPHTEFLEFVIPTVASVIVTCLFVRTIMRFATWGRRLQFALLAAFLLWMLSYLLLVSDDFGVLKWIMD